MHTYTHTHTHTHTHTQSCVHHIPSLQDSGRVIKKRLSDSFDDLLGAMEERKEQLIGEIGWQQDRKLRHVLSLIRRHGDHLEGGAKLLETASQTMEEPPMAVFIQVHTHTHTDH